MNANPVAKGQVIVCIPTYNKAQFLKQSLASILNQTFEDFQLYVVDDASADGTGDAVRSFGDSRVRYFCNVKNLGLSGNWNRCIELALGNGAPYIGIFHDDDLYAPSLLAREVAFLERETRAGFVYPAMIHFVQADDRKRLIQLYPDDRVMTASEALNDLCLHSRYYVSSPALLARRSAYQKAGQFDARYKYTPDYDLWWRMAEHGDIGYIAEPLLTQRIHSGELSASRAAFVDALSQAELFDILCAALKRIERRMPELNAGLYERGIKRFCAKHCLLAGKIALELGEHAMAQKAANHARNLSAHWTIRLGAAALNALNHNFGKVLLTSTLQWDRWINRTFGGRLWPQDLFMVS